MAFNAYLIFHSDTGVKGESTSLPEDDAKDAGAIEVSSYGFGVNMVATQSRSDGGGATTGRATFDSFTCEKGIDTATTKLVELCCKGTAIKKAVLHLYRQGEGSDSGVVKYAMVVFGHCVITKVGVSGGGDDLPKETLEFNYGVISYYYQATDHETGKAVDGKAPDKFGWTTISNKVWAPDQDFAAFKPS